MMIMMVWKAMVVLISIMTNDGDGYDNGEYAYDDDDGCACRIMHNNASGYATIVL